MWYVHLKHKPTSANDSLKVAEPIIVKTNTFEYLL